MADEDDKLEVEIVDAPPVAEVAEAPAAPAAKVVTEEEGVADLKARLEAATARADAAERRARDVATVADQQITRANTTDLALIDAGISTAQREIEIAKANKKAYMARQDFDKATEMDDLITQHRMDLQELQRGKQALSAQIEEAQRQPPPRAQPQADPVEAFASQLTGPSADWIRAHPQFARDERLKTKMIGAHYKAIGDGIEPDSAAYFAYVEKDLGIGRQAAAQTDDNPLSSASQGESRRSAAAPPAAPVSRSGTGDGVNTSRRVRLTKEEAEIARMSGQTPEEYYRAKEELKRAGRIH